eukprot:9213257-Pyramimonas_sp.AAC.1
MLVAGAAAQTSPASAPFLERYRGTSVPGHHGGGLFVRGAVLALVQDTLATHGALTELLKLRAEPQLRRLRVL